MGNMKEFITSLLQESERRKKGMTRGSYGKLEELAVALLNNVTSPERCQLIACGDASGKTENSYIYSDYWEFNNVPREEYEKVKEYMGHPGYFFRTIYAYGILYIELSKG